MSVQSQEARVILAIKAICTTKKMSIRGAVKIYGVPEATIRHRIKGRVLKLEKRNARYNLTPTKEETLVQYVLDLDARGFSPWIDGVGDMANLLLATCCETPVGKQ